tara:strand:+ start:647 stop:1510 length:864 start_codon:yes stop_codon:yes gene_type:complete
MKITRKQLRRLITETMITPYTDQAQAAYIQKILDDPQVDDGLKELLASDDEETVRQGLDLLSTLYPEDYEYADVADTYRGQIRGQEYWDTFYDRSARGGINMHLKEPILSRAETNGGMDRRNVNEALNAVLNDGKPQHIKAFLEGELYLVSRVEQDDTGFFDSHSLNIPDIGVETTKYTLLTEDEHTEYRDTIYDHFENVLLPIFYDEWEQGYEREPGVQLIYWSPFAGETSGTLEGGWTEFAEPVMPHVETYFDDQDPDDVAALAELKKQFKRYYSGNDHHGIQVY